MLCRKENIIPKVDPSKIKIYSLSDKVNLKEDSNQNPYLNIAQRAVALTYNFSKKTLAV